MKMAASSMGHDSQPQVKYGWDRLAFAMDFTSMIVSDLSCGEDFLTQCGHDSHDSLQMVQHPSVEQEGCSGILAIEMVQGGG
jgi:hypothetical protein